MADDSRDVHALDTEIARLRARVRELEAPQQAPAGAPSAPSLQMVLEHSPDAIVVVDRELRLLYVNRTFAPRTVAEVLNRSALDFIPASFQAATAAALRRVLETGTVEQLEVQSESGYVWEARLAPIKQDDEIVAVLGIGVDVSQRKRLEGQRREAHKLEALGRITAGIAHNFNNMLTVILTNVRLTSPHVPPTFQARLSDADLAAQRAADMVRDLLVFASGRQDAAQMQPTNLTELVQRALALAGASLGGIAVDLEIAGEIPLARVDPGRIEQVLLNILINARDALAGQVEPAPRIQLLLDTAMQTSGAGLEPRRAARVRRATTDRACPRRCAAAYSSHSSRPRRWAAAPASASPRPTAR